jgi:hypothetical protein
VTAAARNERLILPWIAVIAGFLLFAGLTVAYVTYSVNASQHRWCTTINLLNSSPPPAGSPSRNPSRAYEQHLAADFRDLKASLGC